MRRTHRGRNPAWRRHWRHIRIKRRASKGGPRWWRRASHHTKRWRRSHERWWASHHGIWWGSWASKPQGLLLSHPELPRVESLTVPPVPATLRHYRRPRSSTRRPGVFYWPDRSSISCEGGGDSGGLRDEWWNFPSILTLRAASGSLLAKGPADFESGMETAS